MRTTEQKRSRRGCGSRLVLALMGLGVGLVLVEGVCKWLDVRTARQRQKVTQRISRPSDLPGVRFEMIPNIVSVTPNERAEVRINNLGFRGPDVLSEKAEGTFRIAVLGDSIAFGRTYEEAEIFPSLLEANLRHRFPQWGFEVVNAALSGRDTWEEAVVLEHRVLPLDPDLVILQICLNDHVRLEPPDRAAGVGMFGEQPWYTYSSLFRLLDRRVNGFRTAHAAVLRGLGLGYLTGNQFLKTQVVTLAQLSDVSVHWEAWSRELLRIRDLVHGQGAEILFVIFPTSFLMKAGEAETLPELTALTRDHQIPYLDMIEFYGSNTQRFLRDYTHPSLLGHRVAAHAMGGAIVALFAGQVGEP